MVCPYSDFSELMFLFIWFLIVRIVSSSIECTYPRPRVKPIPKRILRGLKDDLYLGRWRESFGLVIVLRKWLNKWEDSFLEFASIDCLLLALFKAYNVSYWSSRLLIHILRL